MAALDGVADGSQQGCFAHRLGEKIDRAILHGADAAGDVRVAGMTVRSDDLIHADQHGAIVIPVDIAAKLPEAAELCGRRETPILEIARSPSFSLDKLKEALKRSSEIH